MMKQAVLLQEKIHVLENIIEEKDSYINLLEQCLIDIGADIKKEMNTSFVPEKMIDVSTKFITVSFNKTMAVRSRNCEELEHIERVLRGGEQ